MDPGHGMPGFIGACSNRAIPGMPDEHKALLWQQRRTKPFGRVYTKEDDNMRHVSTITKTLPARAQTHPSIGDSIKGFLSDPLGVIRLHLGKDGAAE